jgi:arsenate reductase-like glutaredoxin family protein
MISRLENKIKNEKISPGMLKETFSALEDRLNDLTPKQQKKFLELQLFKKKGIEDLDNISELFVEMSEQEGTRSELFELLKNQEFISLLMSEPLTPEKYSSTLFNQNGTDLAVV